MSWLHRRNVGTISVFGAITKCEPPCRQCLKHVTELIEALDHLPCFAFTPFGETVGSAATAPHSEEFDELPF